MNDSTAANEPTPIVHNGVMFLANPGNIVQALDARTGELIWENRVGPDLSNGAGRHSQPRAVSGQGVPRDHGRAAAGAGRAQRQDRLGNAHRAIRRKATAIPVARSSIHGKVIQGMGGCDRYKDTGCFISAYDAQTGKQLWKFETVAREGDSRRRYLGQAARICCGPVATPGSPAATIRSWI